MELEWGDDLPYSIATDNLYLPFDTQLEFTEACIISNKLIKQWQQPTSQYNHFTLADTQFKAGLTFLLSWQNWLKYAPEKASLYYFSCESEPLKKEDLVRILKVFPKLELQATLLVEQYPILTPGFHYLSFEQGRINLILMLGDLDSNLQELIICGTKDLEYKLRQFSIDAWLLKKYSFHNLLKSQEFFTKIALLSSPKATLTAIAMPKEVQAALQNVGFKIKKKSCLNYKEQIFYAQFNKVSQSLKIKKTPWYLPPIKIEHVGKAIVIGGGLAGCTMAHFLAKKGCEVFLIDNQEELASGASGNPQAILYPQFSAYQSPISQFMLTAYLYAYSFYKQALLGHPIGELKGILQLAYNSHEQKLIEKINTHIFAHYPELGQFISAEDVKLYANLEMAYDALFLPLSGWINSKELCKMLLSDSQIYHISNCEINSLYYDDKTWFCNEISADAVILANGYQANQFDESSFLPLIPTSGLVTFIKTNSELAKLAIPICGQGHILPNLNNKHAIGATYHPNKTNLEDLHTEDDKNLAKLNILLPSCKRSKAVVGHWMGVRTTTPDYFPIVGPIPKEYVFKDLFSPLAKDPKRWLPITSDVYQGLYAFTGFGSRGLTTIPLCADWLSALITRQPFALPSSFIRFLSPARFLLKDIVKHSANLSDKK
ncbi:putative peptidase [Legionella busanensis]|uniref:tRNA 5-methylaminomethyl-2-thiouridine biosynthesis bifunctional protein MnmC n=1 Tax=Legionella busanensis TaxID=190655 RepID=A0A378JKH4_9GAMM|nr:FAD-dependent 5-carboxymethylaminomethyl-2-thiouridine(34) oxidoreductase MnmC [Legionella busanensis]STX51674.1 putative peptidase [Legionella busanensis]